MGDGSKQCYVWAPDAAPSGHVTQRSTASGLRCHGTTICPARPSFVTWTRPRPATNGNLQVNRPAGLPPARHSIQCCLLHATPSTVHVRQLLALRTAARSALDAGSADRFTATPDDPPAAPARTRRRSGGRVCAAWSGTVGAGARGRGPGWHGARPRHMSRTRPCGGWVGGLTAR